VIDLAEQRLRDWRCRGTDFSKHGS
jgi:hypothetical protein